MIALEHAPEAGVLAGRSILIAEDEALIALDLEEIVERHGGRVVGPYATLDKLLDGLASETFDAAILDIMVGRKEVFPAAAILQERKIGFIFHSGHVDSHDLTERFPGAPLCTKPSPDGRVLSALLAVLAERPKTAEET